MYAAASLKKIILIKDLIFIKISKILLLFTAVTVFCFPFRNLIVKELSYHRIDRITLDYQISFINDIESTYFIGFITSAKSYKYFLMIACSFM